MPKVYEKIKIHNETIHNKMSEMQVAGKKQIDNGQHFNSKFNHRAEKNREKKHVFLADAVKSFDKQPLQDCIKELAKLDYNKNDLEKLHKLNETVQFKINTPYGDTENIEIKEVVKQGTTYGPIMCCASAAVRLVETQYANMAIWK